MTSCPAVEEKPFITAQPWATQFTSREIRFTLAVEQFSKNRVLVLKYLEAQPQLIL